jgi:hypothetical protein
MAIFSAPDLITKNRHMGEFGNCVVHWGSVTPGAGALGDVYRLCIIAGGLEVTDISLTFADLDTGSALAVKIGFTPVNATEGPAEVLDYFSAADTFLAGTTKQKWLSFDPIKFERPVILVMTVTTAATTFAPGKITAKVYADGLGIK